MIGMRACACVRLWNGVTSSRPSKTERPRYRTPTTTTHTHGVYGGGGALSIFEKDFKFEPKMLFWPSLFLSLEILN